VPFAEGSTGPDSVLLRGRAAPVNAVAFTADGLAFGRCAGVAPRGFVCGRRVRTRRSSARVVVRLRRNGVRRL